MGNPDEFGEPLRIRFACCVVPQGLVQVLCHGPQHARLLDRPALHLLVVVGPLRRLARRRGEARRRASQNEGGGGCQYWHPPPPFFEMEQTGMTL
eukprot:2334872-Pyramimonas_sp.AAC.1